jgi:hypothetical protein
MVLGTWLVVYELDRIASLKEKETRNSCSLSQKEKVHALCKKDEFDRLTFLSFVTYLLSALPPEGGSV